ncbi:diguanylate cyclase [Microbulbifer sp. A4B17]|uniref:HD-GYP domain-containing protein n=1 Tax=Microbulbifer sp. A4B17 TaxID=359370 RepID=UPI000D52E316|nr:HD-GYP domain-containing protein [Microbulbifer sp. A4B17]AWF79584.1 diguanylate cyclase [Microbulbifer sp. A4B17]
MAIEQAKISVGDLQRGMFVSKLDRPWTRTPFALQGFYIRDLEEIRQLQKYCRFVYVDVHKTVGSAGVTLRRLLGGSDTSARGRSSGRTAVTIPCKPVTVSHKKYPPPQPAQREASNARKLHGQILYGMSEVMGFVANNRPIPVQQVNQVVEDLVESVLRSPDAFAWLARVRDKDEHTYSHSVRASIWAVLFGRHIGLSRSDLLKLGVATLLKDVGKLAIDGEVLQMKQRDPRSELEYRKFVQHSVKMLSADPQIDPKVIEVISAHCERHDGSGYPEGLRGDRISVLARMCGIVTFYDEATNPRGSSEPVAPSRAVAKLYDLRGIAYQEQLVVEFIQAIGLYPTGTQVELSTGEVGVVVEQTYDRRLRPKVMIVLDGQKQTLSKPRLCDLAEVEDREQKLIERGKMSVEEKISILRDIEPGAYPQVDAANIRDNYLFRGGRLGQLLTRLTK